MDQAALIEIALSLFAILAWALVMVRFSSVLRKRWSEYGLMVVLLVVWVSLFALLMRALYDAGIVGRDVAFLSAAVVRGVFFIGGLALFLAGPQKEGKT